VEVLQDCKLEPHLIKAIPGEYYQFLRMAYFTVDAVDSKPGEPVFDRTVTLRDAWANIVKKGGGE
jgi:glutaminyl-tRNA synthetase